MSSKQRLARLSYIDVAKITQILVVSWDIMNDSKYMGKYSIDICVSDLRYLVYRCLISSDTC